MRRFVAAYFRHPFLLVLPAIIIPLIVVFAVRAFASTYTSQATVVITYSFVSVSTGDSPYNTPAQNLQGDLKESLTVHTFVTKVAQDSGMIQTYAKGTADVQSLVYTRITSGLSITVEGTRTLLITYSDPNPQLAAKVITVFLNDYQQQRIANLQQNANEDLAIYEQMLQQDEATLHAADQARQAYIQQNPTADPSTDATLAQYEQAYQQALQNVNNDQINIEKISDRSNLAETLTTFTVADPPLVPTAPTVKSKTTITAMIGGVALGLGISLGLIGLLAVTDRRIHSRDDIIEVMPVPVLEVIPKLRGLREESLVVGSEENLLQFPQVPVLATLPRFAESASSSSDSSRTFTTRAEG
jgi:capsular polysaccharide biosynthesis protein